MPSYAPAAEAIGGNLGGAAGAAGGGLLGSLGSLLAPLDYPRQALWNLARSVGRGLTNQGSWDDALRAIPGAAGALGTSILAGSGVGMPAAIGLGSLVGGIGQGFGNATDEDKFKAPTAEDVTGSDNPLLNMLVSAAGDPLTFAGSGAGAVKGAQAGKSFGKGLEEAALWRGPRYAGSAEEKLASITGALQPGMDPEKMKALEGWHSYLSGNPEALNEIPTGSQYLGHGAEAIGLRKPDGGVVTVARPSEKVNNIMLRSGESGVDFTRPPLTRPDIPEQLQATRSRPIFGDSPARVEHAPFMDILGGSTIPQGSDAEQLAWINGRDKMRREAEQMREKLAPQGLNFWDAHHGNVGHTPEGQTLITDANAIQDNLRTGLGRERNWDDFRGGADTGVPIPRAADMEQHDPGMLKNLLLNLLGSDQSIQGELAASANQYRGGSTVLGPISQNQAVAQALGANTPTNKIVPPLAGMGTTNPSPLLNRLQRFAR